MILLIFGGLAKEEAKDRPETADNIEDGNRGGGPPEDGVTEEVNVVVGFFAAVVVQTSAEEEPAPWMRCVGFTGFVRVGEVGGVRVEGGCKVMVGPPHDFVDLDELFEEAQGLVRVRWGLRRHFGCKEYKNQWLVRILLC